MLCRRVNLFKYRAALLGLFKVAVGTSTLHNKVNYKLIEESYRRPWLWICLTEYSTNKTIS